MDEVKRWRQLAIATWVVTGGLAVLAFGALFVLAATDPDENIALGGNAVARTADGGREWRGIFWNHSDSLYTRLDAIVLFLDARGRPVARAEGGAARLDPGEVFHVRARLPDDAAKMQVYRLRWTSEGGGKADLGPFRPWPFGYVNDKGCDRARLALGSCTPMREAS